MYVFMYCRDWIGLLAVDFSPQWPRFNSRAVPVGFVVSEVERGRIFLRALRFPPANFHSTNASYSSIIGGVYSMSIRGRSTEGPSLTPNSYIIGYIAHEKAIFRNPPMHSFTGNRKNLADPQ
jgi:hypothetical protein